MLAIYSDFGHLLDNENKLGTIDGLGVTSLLELKKLPDRFRKEIEVVYTDGDEEKHVIKKVIDEDKLSDFLDTTVEFEGKPMKVKDLPASELNKQIKLAQGVYEPSDWGDRNDAFNDISDKSEAIVSDAIVIPQDNNKAVKGGVSPIYDVTNILSNIFGELHSLYPLFEKIDDSLLMETSDKDITELKTQLKVFLSNFEGTYLKIKELEGKLN
jgi:hypothetical protein